jgi:hypothetical protein
MRNKNLMQGVIIRRPRAEDLKMDTSSDEEIQES